MAKILILGGSGMVGKNLLVNQPAGHECLAPTSQELNLLDYGKCLEYLQTHQPDLIILCAGIVGGIHANMADPVKFLMDNTDIGRNVVWAAYNAGIRSVMNIGSSCMYPRNAVNPLKEEMVLAGELEPTNEGYAIAKIFTQRLCSYISRQYPEFHYKTVIPCNLYGAYDKFEEEKSHLIPAIIRKVHDAKVNGLKEVEIWGDGTARREFMFATDLVEILWNLVDRFEEMPELLNVGLGHDHTITEYYQTVSDIIGYEGEFRYDTTKPVGMKQKLVDISRLNALGLKSSYTLAQGIEETYKHYLTLNISDEISVSK